MDCSTVTLGIILDFGQLFTHGLVPLKQRSGHQKFA